MFEHITQIRLSYNDGSLVATTVTGENPNDIARRAAEFIKRTFDSRSDIKVIRYSIKNFPFYVERDAPIKRVEKELAKRIKDHNDQMDRDAKEHWDREIKKYEEWRAEEERKDKEDPGRWWRDFSSS